MNLSDLSRRPWLDQPAIVIGGGPSLARFDWDLLRSWPNLIAINGAFKFVPWAPIFFSEDLRAVELFNRDAAIRPLWKSFKGLKLVAHSNKSAPQLEAVDRDCISVEPKLEGKYWATKFEDGFFMHSNSGTGALNLADVLGADPIYLLGFDLRSEGKKTSNFHDLYPSDWKTADATYANFRHDLEDWAAPHVAHKKVVVLGLESALECWPKWDRDSFLKKGRPDTLIAPFEKQALERTPSAEPYLYLSE